MLLYNIESLAIIMVRKTQRKSQRKGQRQQQRKTQRRNQKKQRQQNGGMAGVLNTALVPFGLLALQKYQQKRVGKKRTNRRNRKSKKN